MPRPREEPEHREGEELRPGNCPFPFCRSHGEPRPLSPATSLGLKVSRQRWRQAEKHTRQKHQTAVMNILQAENSVNGRCVTRSPRRPRQTSSNVSVRAGETAAVGGADMWSTGRERRGPGSFCSSTNQRPIWQRSSGRGPLSCFFSE